MLWNMFGSLHKFKNLYFVRYKLLSVQTLESFQKNPTLSIFWSCLSSVPQDLQWATSDMAPLQQNRLLSTLLATLTGQVCERRIKNKSWNSTLSWRLDLFHSHCNHYGAAKQCCWTILDSIIPCSQPVFQSFKEGCFHIGHIYIPYSAILALSLALVVCSKYCS